MSLTTFHIWSESNLSEELSALAPENEIIVYGAEEQIINDEFDTVCLKNQKSVDFVFGGTYYESFSRYKDIANLHFWSNFWLYNSVYTINHSDVKNKSKNKFLFLSLNNNAHYHRCRMIDILAKNNLLKNGVVSWHRGNIGNYRFKYWRQKKLVLTDNFDKTKNYDYIPKEINKVFLNLVVESVIEGIFVTEKTYKNILISKPFICLAAPKFHKFLESQGFELYDEIISYDFDKEHNLDKRINMIIDQLKYLKEQNYNELYKKIKPKLDYNKKRALEIIRNQEGIPKIARNFKYYDNIIKGAVCRLDILE